ncbi:MAG: phosphoribosylglycinamide synthetase, partial [Gammaproteobacteria bacterium]|nr:phosphoribosylglycinamide synthetase [Gammaproteobacteria bacterium]NIR85086.1 phosphoribosylglycinamide synthetase [Gammaproteobacteria bacterium]NIU03690.1 phosphoribosylglycinamide synthetase [Gammaproteobacteria bacterium]NIV51025.1 phosphoribosylglycinamide synthetase [Gammaproteobacteria bacterium]NIV73546.1 phosphoribosylglycinamide synthetase [Gammaproteobacteria bacterium]
MLIAPRESYRLGSYLRAARALSLETLVVSQGEHSLVPEIARGLQVDFRQPGDALNRIREAVRAHPVDAVIGTDDFSVELASRVAAALGLSHNPPRAAGMTRRKDWARARLGRAGVPVPRHRVIDLC